MNPMRTSLTALAAALLAACAPATPAPAPAPGPLHARCAALPVGEAAACYDAGLLQLLRERGVGAAMEALTIAGENDPDLRRDGHMYAHAIGLAAYSTPDSVATVFSRCTPIFQSGCYHGVIQAYFADADRPAGGAVDARAIVSLCAPYRGGEDDRWALFQCVHGLGHGLTMHHGHHLPTALEACDLLPDPWEREGCYGGVFMESIMQATSPHHALGRPGDGGGEHAHHPDPHAGHGAHAAAPQPFPALAPDDPLHPCTSLPDRYLGACYQMQTSAILFRNGGDVAGAATICDGVQERYRAACYTSLGRDVSAYTVQDDEEAIRLCALGDPAYRSWCHVGYAKNLVDLSAEPGAGMAFCRRLGTEAEKRACYVAIGEEIWALGGARERRLDLCEAAEPAFRPACREAAGL